MKELIPMSQEEPLTLSKLAVSFFGVIVIALGLVITYYSSLSETGIISPRLFTPLGLIVVIIGGIMIISREG
jgi:hypothetical protein